MDSQGKKRRKEERTEGRAGGKECMKGRVALATLHAVTTPTVTMFKLRVCRVGKNAHSFTAPLL